MGLFVSVWADFPKLIGIFYEGPLFVGFVWCGLGQGKFVALTQQGTRNFVNRTWCFRVS